ncbi:glutaredoxin 3 [Kangiella koreensis]|uniref:Glutaredoxin n=1 Tax=Kangiella koreensis (strain DSM 16069 / JCM 12317 / KCTC 12182 / SW-125) TaxID=523791 RepID=C7R8D9_KANKD|nr:glutaredoxin 3 [Kangiella koreensis]ACV27704.1 glutaredoxin 3 [Kangiella koreensis DSM 16069]
MSQVTIYTTRYCPFCVRAKSLLNELQVDFKEIPVDGDAELRAHMESLTGGYTVPQIIINERAIGGCDDLYALHRKGELLPLLQDNNE